VAKYITQAEVKLQMELAQHVLEAAAAAQGMTIVATADVIRVKDTDGSIILSLYAPSWSGSRRFWVAGKFVPYQYKIVGRARFLEKTSFFRADGLQAARDAVPYIRRQTDVELLRKQRDQAIGLRNERTPYRGPDANEIPKEYGSHVEVAALEAYVSGWRSSDATANQQLERMLRNTERAVSDSVWYDILWAGWQVDIARAEAAA
jgi:hypothetical protein